MKKVIERKTSEEIINIALDTINSQKQAIIFVNNKKSAESVAEKISKHVKENEETIDLSKKIIKILTNPTKQCIRLSNTIYKGIAFHHSGLLPEQRKIIEENFKKGLIKIIVATPTLAVGVDLPAFRVIIRDLKRYGVWGMEYIPVLEYEQQAGRAGRPSYDNYGEAIIIAESEKQKQELVERYIKGEPEEIISKLASKPILRTYVLSLIASDFVNNKKDLKEFFNKTFYAKQYGDLKKLDLMIEEIINQLIEWNFLEYKTKETYEKKENSNKHYNKNYFISANNIKNNINNNINKNIDDYLKSTPIGKRVSELYLDPYTANHLIESMKIINETNNSEITLLNMLCGCLELRPLLKVKTSEYDEIELFKSINEEYILNKIEQYEDDYDYFLSILKTSKFFLDWLNEKDEEYLFEKYDVRPGEIYSKLEIIDWLIYSSIELSRMLKLININKELMKLRIRIKYGVKEELLPLLQLKNIGRVRARILFKNNIKNIADIKKIDLSTLSRILGKNIALDIKKQVGQDFSDEKNKIKENKRKGQINLNDFK